MADLHARHRPYLAALADGELELVPAATRDHVAGCAECLRELDSHRLLGRRLRAAAQAQPEAAPPAPRQRGRRLLLPLAAAAVALVVAGVAFATRPAAPDPLASAVLVASQRPEYASSDPVEIASWCTAQYGNRVPVVALPGLVPEGARMDWPNQQGVATVTYSLDSETVHVSWLALAEGSGEPTVVTVNGRPAVLLRKHGITALVTGTASRAELVHVAQEVARVL